MITPEQIDEANHAPRTAVESILEAKFDCAIQDAAAASAWPAIARWLPWPGGMGEASMHVILRVVTRYRSAGWHVVTDLPDPSIIATFTRR